MPLDWEGRSMPFRATQQNFLSFYDDLLLEYLSF